MKMCCMLKLDYFNEQVDFKISSKLIQVSKGLIKYILQRLLKINFVYIHLFVSLAIN